MAFMPSSQETDWAYSMKTVPGTHTGHLYPKYSLQKYLLWVIYKVAKPNAMCFINISYYTRSTDMSAQLRDVKQVVSY